MKNASDAVGVVLKELKKQCPLGSFRLLVAVDGINALWGRTTLRKKDKSAVGNYLPFLWLTQMEKPKGRVWFHLWMIVSGAIKF